MAYVKNNWVDREGTTRYFETVDDDGALIFTPDYTQVTELGTPVNADNMNHIEEGIAAGSFTKFDLNATYAKDDLVTAIVVNELRIYKSLQDNNNGNDLTDSSFWEEVEFSGIGGSGFNLFDTKISDHILDGEEAKGWALQGSYVNGAVYPSFYAKCLGEYNEATNTETVNGVTVKVSANGHKFFDIVDKVSIDGFFNTMGSAWFYGVDTENERIFLPRKQEYTISVDWNNKVTRTLSEVYTAEEDGYVVAYITSAGGNTYLTCTINGQVVSSDHLHGLSGAHYGAELCLPVAKGDTYQVTGAIDNYWFVPYKKILELSQTYLYICVGNTIVNEDQIDVSKVLSEAVLRSSLAEIQTVTETYVNGTSWYRIWSDGWCEQGGVGTSTKALAETQTITLLKAYKDTNYSIQISALLTADNITQIYFQTVSKNTNNFKAKSTYSGNTYNGTVSPNWYACGYIW